MPEAGGKTIRILLDTEPDYTDGYMYGLEKTLAEGTGCAYTFENVQNNSYYVFAVLDMDGNGALGPNNGDYAGYHNGSGTDYPASPSVVVSGNEGVDGVDFTLSAVSGNIQVTGRASFPVSVAGKRLLMALDTDGDYMNGFAYSIEVPSLPSDSYYDYTFTGVTPGSYYLFAAVDVDGDGGLVPNNGDCAGYHNGTTDVPPAAPGSPSITVTGDGAVVDDFTLVLIQGLIEVSGTITMPHAAPGIHMGVALVTDYTSITDAASANLYLLMPGQTVVDYVLTSVPNGTYYLVGAVDTVDDDIVPSHGDFLGFYGGVDPGFGIGPIFPPGTEIISIFPPNIDYSNCQPDVMIAGTGIPDKDFSLGTIP